MSDVAVPQRALRLPVADAQRVLLVHALEESDRAGRVLDLETRRAATRDALAAARKRSEDRWWLTRRARDLVAALTADDAPTRTRVRRLLRWSDPGAGFGVPLLVAALIAGLASNALGPERHVNLLAPPLLALIAWNLAIYALMVMRWTVSILRPDVPVPATVRWLEAAARRWVARITSSEGADGEGRPTAGAGSWSGHFLRRWLPATRRRVVARVRRLLHLAAATTTVGVVLGMYLRGLVLSYRATWESTFLGAGHVEALVGTVLGPAAALLGTGVPAAAPLEAPADGPAAIWIHLWAATAALCIVVPRLALAASETLRLWRAGRRVEIVLPAAYVKRLRASASASTPDVQVVPYSYRPAEKALQTLRGLLQDLAGARAQIRVMPKIDYGESAPAAPDGALRVVVFGLAQTPEVEVHGEWLEALRAELPDGQGLLVLVDEGAYRRRLEATAPDAVEERTTQRRRAWRRVVEGCGLTPSFVDLEASDLAVDETLDRLGAAVWPSAEQGSLAWTA